MDWDKFFCSVDAYVQDMHDAVLLPVEMKAGTALLTVIDADRNRHEWELTYIGVAAYDQMLGYDVKHVNPVMVRMRSRNPGVTVYECIIPRYSWLVGAVLFS